LISASTIPQSPIGAPPSRNSTSMRPRPVAGNDALARRTQAAMASSESGCGQNIIVTRSAKIGAISTMSDSV